MPETKITGEIAVPEEKIKSIFDFKNGLEKKLGQKTSELIEYIISGAIALDSSDIHLEAEEKQAKLRIRIDGNLQDIIFLETKIYQSLVSRIKLLSKLKLNVSDRPQDGRFSVDFKESLIEMRVSSLPAEYGEAIVMRILNPNSLISIEALGLREDLARIFEKEISQPNGMIIITGPTGSGKTTTLYAILKKLNNPEIKIITIEDPIEYHLEGISQTQVDPKKGYDFASGLRSIMRQDPDVILVGEIRDLETAQIALQAALTGHLVLTTIHTNDAAGTIARLQALGEKASNIAPAINLAIGQRLVRKVCLKCVEMKEPSEEELKKIKENLKDIPKKIKIPKAKGCKFCNNTGYKGRLGIYEFLSVDDEMENFILSSPSTVALRNLAVKKGMVLMKQDGFLKILQGLTTIEEVEKATGE